MRQIIFDSHAHYDDESFNEDRDVILDSLPKLGVCNVINCSANLEGSVNSIELSKKYSYIYAAIGVHPEEIASNSDDYISKLRELSKNKKVVAIGEIGLDYHYDEFSKEKQKKVFEEQIKLAVELNLPIIVHDREAHKDTIDLLRKYKPKGVVHCFSGSVEMANEVIELGMYIGLGGVVTFKNAKNPVLVAENIPLERLLIETDAPYMAPVPFRGKRCDSSYINYTADKISEIKNIKKEDLLEITKNNAKVLFNI